MRQRTAPRLGWYVPDGQSRQLALPLFGWYVPGRHMASIVLPLRSLSGHALPARQVMHSAIEVAPVILL